LANEKPGSGGTGDASSAAPRLGGARADFVASLGRKIADLRSVLTTLEGNPDSSLARDDLRRKLHALGTGARMLHFEGMARCILDTESVLARASEDGHARANDLERVASALDELPALAWGEERPADLPHASAPPPPPPALEEGEVGEEPAPTALTPNTISVLVIGPDDLADMLVEDMGAEGAESDFEVERTEDLTKARSIALAFAPDLVVLDGDIKGAADFAQALLDDPLTETAPVLVALTPGRGDAATRYTALGVTKILNRPLLAGALRSACQEAVDQRDGKTIKMTLGEPTVAQLGERLAQEVRRALIDAVDEHGRSTKVKLGDGVEVWGALWGAIARVREVVTASTNGVVQFSGHGPEGALALAPMLSRASGGSLTAPSDRAEGGGRNRDDSMDVNLTGRRVIVADDDPAVTWFIADLLRTAGCVVHEALDGRTALRMAYEISPELVVSDILMPGLDGFALCRALKRDVALRDTPVILLSWKEDLLQRVRELGASAAAYLRKESDARAILARVREVMRPRARIAARLRGEGEVRGRLDGLTVRTLFELVLASRPAARVSVRDASFLYEVELRAGGIHRSSRTSGDGSFLRGDRVIPAMLGVGAGRFVVSSTKRPAGDEPGVPLAEQFSRPIAQARSALHATTGARMMTVAKLVLDDDDIAGYLLATPEPARELVRRLARGTSPREILLHGDVSPALMEDVLADLATRGAVVAVYRQDGSDAMRGEAFDAGSILPDAEGTRSSVAPSAVAFHATTHVSPAKDDSRKIAAMGASLESAVMDAMSTDSEAPRTEVSAAPPVPSTETPPPATTASASSAPATAGDASATPPPAAETSIPVTVEPTADLRPNAAGAPSESAPLPLRPRPPKAAPVKEETAEFPRPLAIGLVILALLVAALGVRSYLGQHAAEPSDPHPQPLVTDTAGVTFENLPTGANVPTGQGLVSVTVGDGVPVRIDGNDAPRGQKGKPIRLPLTVGVHLVSVGTGDRARTRIVEVKANRATNVTLDEP